MQLALQVEGVLGGTNVQAPASPLEPLLLLLEPPELLELLPLPLHTPFTHVPPTPQSPLSLHATPPLDEPPLDELLLDVDPLDDDDEPL